MKNKLSYKWSKIFASKRYDSKDGVITLDPLEQQELLDDCQNQLNDNLRQNFFDQCTDKTQGKFLKKINMSPHDLFEWFKKNV